MENEIFDLYKGTLPEIVRNEETVKRILCDKGNHTICHRIGDRLAGVSVINENAIYLLCVDKAYQSRGIGVELLHKSEEYVLSNGYKKMILGAGKEYIIIPHEKRPIKQDRRNRK